MSFPASVLIATDTTVSGGVDRYVIDVAQAGRSAGAAVTILLERAAEPALRAALTRHGLHVEVRRLHHGSHNAADVVADCRETIEADRPDLLHVVCGSPRSCLSLREVATAAAVPLVLTEQYVPGDLALSAEVISRIDRTYRLAAQVIFVSSGNREEMTRALAAPVDGAVVIPNAVAANAIARRCPTPHRRRARTAARRAAGALRVACVARLAAQKGIDVLLRAVQRLGPQRGLVIDVLGAGPLHTQLLAECESLGLGGAVRFPGWCDDVTSTLANHDLFVLPSRDEGMPFAVLEAMAAGIPVIATDVPGTTEALGDGAFGTLVPRDDPGALALAIAAFQKDPAGALHVAQRAQTHVAEHHALEECMRSTLACWDAAHHKEPPSSTS